MRRSMWSSSIVALALVAGSMAAPALATYPGAEGRIAFVRDGNIWTMRADGSGQTRLTGYGPSASADWPAWSPDGRRIGYQACRLYDGVRNCDIWTMRANGTSKTRLTRHPATEDQPTWSPDGRWLAFTSTRSITGPQDDEELIYRIRATVPYGKAIAVTAAPTEDDDDYFGLWTGDSGPDWSPLGDAIVFMRGGHTGSSGGGWEDVQLVPWTGGALTKVTPHHMGEYWPSWSPGGKRIAYTSRFTYVDDDVDLGFGDSANIFHITPAGEGEKQVTFYSPGSYRFARFPAWSPNTGRWIAYSLWAWSDHLDPSSGTEAIYKVRSGGGYPPVRIANNGTRPDWQPVLASG